MMHNHKGEAVYCPLSEEVVPCTTKCAWCRVIKYRAADGRGNVGYGEIAGYYCAALPIPEMPENLLKEE